MKKTSKAIKQELSNETMKREQRLALDTINARKSAYIDGETDELNKLLGLPTAYMTAYNESLSCGYTSNNNVLYILDNARNRTLSDSEKINLTKELEKIDIESLKSNELKAICKTFDLPITGEKEDLKTRILDYMYDHELPDDSNIFEYLYKSGMMDNLTKLIIRKIGKGNNTISDTCRNIVDNGYKDSLYDDILQSVAEKLYTMFTENTVIWLKEEKRLVYKEVITDENGHFAGYGNFDDEGVCKSTTFLYLFIAVRKCIESYSKDSRNHEISMPENVGFESVDLLSCVESESDIISFMKYIKKEDSKNYSLYCGIIQGIFESRKQLEIAEDFSVNVRKVKYLTEKLYSYAKVYFQNTGKQSIHTIQYVKLNEGGSVILKKEGITYKEFLTGKIIDINDSNKYHTTPKKGVRVYEVQYRIG